MTICSRAKISWRRTSEGSESTTIAEADRLHDLWNCEGNSAESATRVAKSTTLGTRNDGIGGRRDAPTLYLLRLVRTTIWLTAQPRVRRRQLQVVLGRWVRVWMLRRAGMAIISVCWRVAAQVPFHGTLPDRARDELILLCMGAPLWFCDWRTPVSEEVTVSDASPEGAGVCYSTRLSRIGQREAMRANHGSSAASSETLGLWSLFDCIGWLRRSLDWLEVPVARSAAVENDVLAKRVTQACWPDSRHFDDVTTLSLKDMISFHA